MKANLNFKLHLSVDRSIKENWKGLTGFID